MRRKWLTWLIFSGSLLLGLVTMLWLTLVTLELERAELQSTRQSEHERLALWRMESALVPLIMQESSRPLSAYSALSGVDNAYSRMLTPIEQGEVRVLSSLLTHQSPYILIHFQYDATGELSSPQVPTSNTLDLAESNNVATPEQIDRSRIRLDELAQRVPYPELNSILEDEGGLLVRTGTSDPLQQEEEPLQQAAIPNQHPAQQTQAYAPDLLRQQIDERSQQQRELSVKEFQRRNSTAQSTINLMEGLDSTPVEQGPMTAVWVDGELLLVRQIRVDQEEFLQGCWLNWERIAAKLIGEIEDLLPEAKLVPVASRIQRDQPLMLASLPVQLVPGAVSMETLSLFTPVRFSLIIAWIGLLVTAGAVAALLFGAISLGDRRGAFVSAVTHELRTPLTTFRMYTEMLAEGMVPSPEKQQRYLQTLRIEADRLGHLVENVLSYSRLEGTTRATQSQRLNLPELIGRVQQPLTELAQRSNMTLQVETSNQSDWVQGDAAAIERILFNLVDNACKYATGSDRPEIVLDWHSDSRRILLRVRDYGKGISPQAARKLFRPFSKSAGEAAHSAPGVGLGLALCRRLARSMGGDLQIDSTIHPGACLLLILPRAEA